MKTIVVVADNGHTALVRCELVRATLSEGCSRPVQVLPASSVDDVLDILAKGPIDVLIIEDRLRGITGAGLIRWLEKLLIGTTTILLTNDPRILAEPWKLLALSLTRSFPSHCSEIPSNALSNGGSGGRPRSWQRRRRSSQVKERCPLGNNAYRVTALPTVEGLGVRNGRDSTSEGTFPLDFRTDSRLDNWNNYSHVESPVDYGGFSPIHWAPLTPVSTGSHNLTDAPID